MSQSAFNPLTQGIYNGTAPFFYDLSLVKLNLRPYAIGVNLSYTLWQALHRRLVAPKQQLSKWTSLPGWPHRPIGTNLWVPPPSQPHGRWGIDGTIVNIYSEEESKKRGSVEFRFDIRAHSANYPDLLYVYSTLDIFFGALQAVVQDDADWKQEYGVDKPAKNMSWKFGDQPATQLINIESLDPCGMKVALSPLFINWLSDPTYHPEPALMFQMAKERMQQIANYLGPMDGLLYGVGTRLDVSLYAIQTNRNDRLWWLYFSGDEPRTKLSPRKIVIGAVDTRYGYRLQNHTGVAQPYQGIDEKRMVTNLIFLMALIELTDHATRDGDRLHGPGIYTGASRQ